MGKALLPTAPIFRTEKGHRLLVDHMRHLMRDAMRAASLPDDCTLHGLRYTFATRAIELGLDWQITFNKGAVMCLPPGVNKASFADGIWPKPERRQLAAFETAPSPDSICE